MGNSGVEAMAAGGEFSLAIKKGKVYSWGWNAYGQLGDGTKNNYDTPVKVNKLENAEKPVIKPLPEEIVVNEGAEETLTVEAEVSDGGTLSYQWYRNTENSNTGGTEIDGATERSYSVPTDVPGTFYYYVEITNTNSNAVNPTSKITNDVATVIVLPASGQGGAGGSGGSGGGGSEPDESVSPGSTELPLIINGQPYDSIVTGQVTEEDGITKVTATIDKAKLENLLQNEGDNPVIIIPAAAIDADQVVSVLTAETVKIMEDKHAVLEIRTVNGNYKLPAERIAIDRVAAEFGESVDLSQITINVEISRSDASKAQLAETAAENGNFTVIVPPVDFTVTATYNDQTVEIGRFTGYVEREIPIPEGVDANQITIAVVIEDDGTARHVPTYCIERDGVYYAVVLSLTNSTYTLIWNKKEFADVKNHWSQDEVNDLASRLVIRGTSDTMFSPNQNITRAQFAAIIVRALGLSDKGGISPFADVRADDWFAGAVAKAHEYGLLQGYGDGTFRPRNLITRQEAMAILRRALKWTELSGDANDVELTLSRFADHAQVAGWAKEAVATMVEKGIVQGSEGKLNPYGQLTRAEAAAMVHRMLKKSGLID